MITKTGFGTQDAVGDGLVMLVTTFAVLMPTALVMVFVRMAVLVMMLVRMRMLVMVLVCVFVLCHHGLPFRHARQLSCHRYTSSIETASAACSRPTRMRVATCSSESA